MPRKCKTRLQVTRLTNQWEEKSLEAEVQTHILPRPVAQTDAYDILLSKANDERRKMNRQEKGTQAEALDFHAEVQQLQIRDTIMQ